MEEKHFQIKNYPDDIYRTVGELIRWAQEWEEQFKKFAKLLRVNKINIDIAFLNVLTAARSEFFGPRHDLYPQQSAVTLSQGAARRAG